MSSLKTTFLVVVGAATVGLAGSMFLSYASYVSNGRDIWYLARASGLVAYGVLALATIWGLLTSSRLFMKWLKLPLTSELHQTLSLIGLAAIALHGWVLLYDVSYGFSLSNLLVPFTSPYRPVAVASGVAAGYLAAILSLSFYVRHIIGQRAWRAMHFATFAAFLLALAHGIWTGSDSTTLPVGLLYASTGGAVLFLTYVRILGGRYIPTRRKVPAHLPAGAASPEPQPAVATPRWYP